MIFLVKASALFILFTAPALGFILPACTGIDKDAKSFNADDIYLDYKIKGDEKDSNVTVTLQFRRFNQNGPTVALGDAATVALDGESVPVDSSKLGGIYYEIRKPIEGFIGEHEIVFTDAKKQQYKEQFSFRPFSLVSDRSVAGANVPRVIHRDHLAFNFDGIDSTFALRVFATDTSFTSKDINEIDTLTNHRLIFSPQKLTRLVNGPVVFQFLKEMEKPLKNGPGRGGEIVISYGLQREFVLQD